MRKPGGLQWVAGAKTPDKVYVTRVFNYGTLEEWRQMKKRFTPGQIREAVDHPLRGQWTRRAKRFAEVLFDVRMSDEAVISYDA